MAGRGWSAAVFLVCLSWLCPSTPSTPSPPKPCLHHHAPPRLPTRRLIPVDPLGGSAILRCPAPGCRWLRATAPAEAATADCSGAARERSQQRSAAFSNESTASARSVSAASPDPMRRSSHMARITVRRPGNRRDQYGCHTCVIHRCQLRPQSDGESAPGGSCAIMNFLKWHRERTGQSFSVRSIGADFRGE
jgi:hypothetical protein